MKWYKQLERLSVWKKDILLGSIGNVMEWIMLDKLLYGVREVDLPSKCRVTDVADDHSQNSSEEPVSTPVHITGSPETCSM
jgi:hypothetical protein